MTRKLYWIAINSIAAILAASLLAAVMTIAIHGTGPGTLLIQREVEGRAFSLAMVAALLGFLFTAYTHSPRWYWLLLTGFVTVASAISFLGYLIPYGQFSFWLASNGLAFAGVSILAGNVCLDAAVGASHLPASHGGQ